MIRTVLITLLCGLLVPLASGQGSERRPRKDAPKAPASRGLAERLAGAWGETVEPQEETLLTSASLAARKLGSVDRRRLDELGQKLADIRAEERQLQRMLADLNRGIPVALDLVPEPDLGGRPVDQARLDEERRAVLALSAELERRRRARDEQMRRRERDRRARRNTVRSDSLLDLDLSVPPAPAASPDRRPVGGRHAVRLADALYRSGDHRGATRQYEAALAAKDPKMTAEKLYRLARSHEHLGDFTSARRALDALFAKSPNQESFWNKRAVQLRTLLEKSESLQKLLRSDKP